MNFAVSISELDRAFLAGFLEGEAHLRIHRVDGRDHRDRGRQLPRGDVEAAEGAPGQLVAAAATTAAELSANEPCHSV
jgi:hypothetical protein